jgi:Leucine-rich repeat (LRR) protein
LILNDAILSGDLNLSNKNLKEFPKFCNMYNLIDTISCDLSKNQLNEFPKEICIFIVLETLILYSNNIKSIPDSVYNLKSLKLLDLSGNSLTYLPSSICTLKLLEVLNVNNNKLVSLPEEILELEKLIQLDVSCNEIQNIPITIGEMKSLRSLNIRRNLLVELPNTISKCKLVNLDISYNRITRLPIGFREIITLIDLNVESNPLESPPASLCAKGILHIMKYLLNETIKQEKKQGILSENEFQSSMGTFFYKSSKNNNSGFSIENRTKDETSIINNNSKFYNNQLDNSTGTHSREISKKINEEQLMLLEKQRNEIHKMSLKNQDLKPYRSYLSSDNYFQPKKENSIAIEKIYNENRSYNSLNNLNNDLKIGKSDEINELYFSKNSIDNLYSNNKDGNLVNEKWSTLPKYCPNNYKQNKEENIYIQKSIDSVDSVVNDISTKKSIFTIRRNLYNQHQEFEEIEFLKRIIETKLKIILQDDVASSIKNGVILCHLLNHIYPRAIQIIHIPSMSMPTLSMAKSRKNVESFIEACQKFGLNSDEICSSNDIIESKNTHKVARTIMSIIKYNQEISLQNTPEKQQQTAV